MSRTSENVKNWRKSVKQRIVDSMGGKCQICEYDKCNNALELHHIDPNEKEMSFGSIVANPKSWKDVIVPELRKCILLCCRCHREFHAGQVELPSDFYKFNEDYFDYIKNNKFTSPCPICQKEKPISQKFCSKSCSCKSSHEEGFQIKWDQVDLQQLVSDDYSYSKIAKLLKCSAASVSRKVINLGIKQKQEKVKWPSREELEILVWEKPINEIAKSIGITGNGLKKKCLKLKIKTPPTGYWSKR